MTTIIDRRDLKVEVERDGDYVRLTAQMLRVGQTVTVGLDVFEAEDLARQIQLIVDDISLIQPQKGR